MPLLLLPILSQGAESFATSPALAAAAIANHIVMDVQDKQVVPTPR